MTHKYMLLLRNAMQDRAGSATVEFVLVLPILLALMAFAVQYGNALSIRNNLDVATRDAARYLARTPLSDSSGATIHPSFTLKSRQMVEQRVLNTKSTITNFSATSDQTGANVQVTISVPFPLLAWIGPFDTASPSMSMSSSEYWVRTGDRIIMVPVGG